MSIPEPVFVGFFPTEDAAREVIDGPTERFDLHAYRLFPLEYDGGGVRPWSVLLSVEAELEGAHEICKEIGAGDYEPGPYDLFEVLRRRE